MLQDDNDKRRQMTAYMHKPFHIFPCDIIQVAEQRGIRTLMEKVVTVLDFADIEFSFWWHFWEGQW